MGITDKQKEEFGALIFIILVGIIIGMSIVFDFGIAILSGTVWLIIVLIIRYLDAGRNGPND